MTAVEWDAVLRLCAAAIAGGALGANRHASGKRVGARTLALVSLGAAVAAIIAVRDPIIAALPNARSRAFQGVIQGVFTGIGFLGAGVILHQRREVKGLTTAASVWVAAALGVSCGFAAWTITITALALALIILILGERFEDWLTRHFDPIVPSDRGEEGPP